MNSLPPGYIDIGSVAMHVSEIRPHTTCVHRFQKYLPLALECYEKRGVDKAAASALIDQADRRDLLMATLHELICLWQWQQDQQSN